MKKLTSLLLALGLCLSLAVPALAAGMPTQEQAEKLIEWKSSLLTDNHKATQDFAVSGEIHLTPIDEDIPDTLPSYTATTREDRLTVKHLGSKDDGSYIYVTGYAYQLGQDGVYCAEGGISNELHLIKDRGLILWEEGLEDGDEVRLQAGESITFTLPDKSSFVSLDPKETLYHIQVCIYYPQYESGYYIQEFFKIDPETVEKVLSAPPETGTPFTDVAANSPYLEAINWAVERNITKGTTETTFSPNSHCTIKHILTFLWRANGKPGAGGDEQSAVLAWAKEKGIVPSETGARCTRATAVTYLWKAAGSPAPDHEASFQDVDSGADYAAAVSWAVENGITSGTTKTTFGPHDFCTRGQIVTFLYRASK